MKHAIVKILNWIIQTFFMPVLRWAATGIPQVQAIKESRESEKEYTLADSRINPIVLMAAFQDHVDMMENDPDNCQAMLNGCMESLRSSETIFNASLAMLGSLVGSGYPQEEAFIRMGANYILLGILMERRMQTSTNTAARRSP